MSVHVDYQTQSVGVSFVAEDAVAAVRDAYNKAAKAFPEWREPVMIEVRIYAQEEKQCPT